MKLTSHVILFLTSIILLSFQEQSKRVRPSPNREMIVKAHKLIREYHSGAEYANNVVKVVYFHGNDLEPLNNWKDRLPRTLDDVSDFYSEEFLGRRKECCIFFGFCSSLNKSSCFYSIGQIYE